MKGGEKLLELSRRATRKREEKKQEKKPPVAGSDRLRLGPVGDRPMFENFNYYSVGEGSKEEGGLLKKMLKVLKGDGDYSQPINPEQDRQDNELGEAVKLLESIEKGLGKITPNETKLPSDDKEKMMQADLRRKQIRELIDLDNLPEIKDAAAKLRKSAKKKRLKKAVDTVKPTEKSLSWKIKLSPEEEIEFQKFWNTNKKVQQWRKEFKDEYKENPDIDTPHYDYRRAWKEGPNEWPERIKEDNRFHWGSAGKNVNHPTYLKQFNKDEIQKRLDTLQAGISRQEEDFSLEATMRGLADLERETFERFPYPDDPQMIKVYTEIGKKYADEIGVAPIPPNRVHLLIYAEDLDPNFKKFFEGLGIEDEGGTFRTEPDE